MANKVQAFFRFANDRLEIWVDDGRMSAQSVVPDPLALGDQLRSSNVPCNWGGDFDTVHRLDGVPQDRAADVLQVLKHYYPKATNGKPVVWSWKH